MTVRLDPGRELKEFLVKPGDAVKEGAVLAAYDNASLLLEKEQLLLDREQQAFELENAELGLKNLKQQRNQAEAAQKGELDLQILSAQAELEQKEYDLGRKDREIALLEEKLAVTEVVSPCEGIVAGTDPEGGSISIVSEGSYEFSFSVSEEELAGFRRGDPVLVASRDGSLICKGTVSLVGSGEPGETETASGAARASMYPVRGTVTGAEGFLPGQHVYIEKDTTGETAGSGAGAGEISGDGSSVGEDAGGGAGAGEISGDGSSAGEASGAGTAEERGGAPGTGEEGMEILLPEGYVEDASGKPWVWAAGGDGCLEKRSVVLGAYNDRHSAWQVTEGLSMTDYLAWPSALLEEGQKADFGELNTP